MLSRCHAGIQPSRTAAEQWKYKAESSAPVSLSLALHAEVQYSLLYTVQSAYADSAALANSITEGSMLLGPDYTELVHGRCEARAPSAEIGLKNILNWFAHGGAGCAFQYLIQLRAVCTNSITDKLHLSISCLLQFNLIQQQTHVTSSSSRVDRSIRLIPTGGDSRREILQLIQIIWNSI